MLIHFTRLAGIMQRTSQTVSGLRAEHRDDSGSGSVSLSSAVLKDELDLIQITLFVTEHSKMFRIPFRRVLRLVPILRDTLGVYV